jgi:hypothetical protein
MIDVSCICKFDNVLVMRDTLNQALVSEITRTTVCMLRLLHIIPCLCKRKLDIDLCRVSDPKQATL